MSPGSYTHLDVYKRQDGAEHLGVIGIRPLDIICGDLKGVQSFIRRRSMSRLAVDIDVDLGGFGHESSRTGGNHAFWQERPQMDAEHLAAIVFGEDPALADRVRAAQGFLGRLEDEQDIVIKFFDRVDVRCV